MIGDPRLSTLLHGLRRARARIRERLLMRDAYVGAAIVLGVVAAGRLVGAFVPAAGLWSGMRTGSAAIVVGLVVLVGLVAWQHVRRSVPSVAELARRADERYRLQERVSTAFEVGEGMGGARRSALQPFLMTDAAEVASRVEPQALVEVPLARPARWFVLALVAVVAVHLVPLRSAATPSGGGTPTGSAPGGGVAAAVPTVTDVQRAAALVAQDAFVRNDPNLQTIAASLQDLGARMASGQIQSGTVAREVSRLRVELQAAYGQITSPPDASTRLASTSAPQGSPAAPPGAAGAAAQPSAGQGLKVKITSEGAAPSSSLSDLVQQLEAGAPNRIRSKAPGAGALSQMGTTPGPTLHAPGTYARQDPAQAALFKQANAVLDQAGSPGGQPAGAARHATQGPGDAAGQGSQPLSQGAPLPGGKSAAASGAKVDLPSAEVAGGQRIQLNAAPDTHRVQVTDVAPGAAVAGAAPSETARPVGPIVDGMERSAVGRYFLPSDAPASGSRGSTP